MSAEAASRSVGTATDSSRTATPLSTDMPASASRSSGRLEVSSFTLTPGFEFVSR